MTTPSKIQVLVVDDDPSIRESVAMLLMSGGYDVAAAEDGFQALLQLRNMSPDVILSDLNMPRMSGFELLSVVRRRFPQILTVAMSGAYRSDDLPPGVIADGFYAKGQHPENLFRSLKHLLSEAAVQSGRHHRELSPAWIPRNGHDAQGVPYVTVTCMECLRAFPVTVVEETSGHVLEIQCRFCPSTNQYIIEPPNESMHDVYAG
jgi:CheY-like chemotaxis protein